MIRSGQVTVDRQVELRPSALVGPSQQVQIKDGEAYVSRAAYKLLQAFEQFSIPPLTGKWAIDIGASTGGFTQVLLERDASHVFSVDVGTGQLSEELLRDPRVFSLESTDARTINIGSLVQVASKRNAGISQSGLALVVVDVSFISLHHFLPLFVQEFGGVPIIALFKPQFEVGREGLGKSGVVRSSSLASQALEDFKSAVIARGGEVLAVEKSEIIGSQGNQEFLMWITFPRLQHPQELSAANQVSRLTPATSDATSFATQAAIPHEEV